ncbi:hypothetical protein OG225_03370 [Nocardia sp. NBC_01377]|uniref:hypothetical protein n=1 Tax=Nocardia sp. NBC_01377 TaxID=2903595 RepID=UPI00325221F8
MITFLLTMAIIVAFGVFLVRGRTPAGSRDVIDRDAQRVRAELDVILGRASQHH